MSRSLLAILSPVILVGLVSTGRATELTRTSSSIEPTPVPLIGDGPGWDTVSSSPIPTGRSAIGWIGDYVYVFGNEDNPSLALSWHVPTETWGNSTPCPVPGFNWTGTVADGELYVLGRYDGTDPKNDFWKFTPDGSGGGSWIQLASYPLAATMIALGTDEGNGLIYAAGGYSNAVQRAAYVYDIDQNNWSAISSLPDPRAAVGGAFVKHKFYVVGGLDSVYTNYTNTLYEYNPDSLKWFERRELGYTIGFNWSSVTADTNYLFQVGGGGGYHIWTASKYVYYYDPEADVWASLDQLPTAYGTNNAVWVGATVPYLLSTGGWNGIEYVGFTFKLTDLPVGVEETSNFEFPISNFQSLESFPNPFVHATTIRYHLTRRHRDAGMGRPGSRIQDPGSQVSLAIYDLSGRLVRTLLDEPSNHSTVRPWSEVVWDGRDRSGRSVPPGAYFYRLSVGPHRAAKKVVVLR